MKLITELCVKVYNVFKFRNLKKKKKKLKTTVSLVKKLCDYELLKMFSKNKKKIMYCVLFFFFLT